MAYQYCLHCENGMETPTLREAVEGIRTCPKCHIQQQTAGNTGQQALLEAMEWLFEKETKDGNAPPFN